MNTGPLVIKPRREKSDWLSHSRVRGIILQVDLETFLLVGFYQECTGLSGRPLEEANFSGSGGGILGVWEERSPGSDTPACLPPASPHIPTPVGHQHAPPPGPELGCPDSNSASLGPGTASWRVTDA